MSHPCSQFPLDTMTNKYYSSFLCYVVTEAEVVYMGVPHNCEKALGSRSTYFKTPEALPPRQSFLLWQSNRGCFVPLSFYSHTVAHIVEKGRERHGEEQGNREYRRTRSACLSCWVLLFSGDNNDMISKGKSNYFQNITTLSLQASPHSQMQCYWVKAWFKHVFMTAIESINPYEILRETTILYLDKGVYRWNYVVELWKGLKRLK